MDNNTIRYLREQVSEGIRKVFASQEEIAAGKIYTADYSGISLGRTGRIRLTRSGRLRDALTAAQFNLNISGTGGISTEVRLPNYIRFLDMKENGNWIYNRPIWGNLYCETQADIKYEYRDWAHRNLGDSLKEIDSRKY